MLFFFAVKQFTWNCEDLTFIPVRLIIGFLHAEHIVVNALVVPLASFIEEEHFFGDWVCVDQVKVQALVLLEERPVRCRAPVVVLGDWDYLVYGHIYGLNASELQCIELQKWSLGVELHS